MRFRTCQPPTKFVRFLHVYRKDTTFSEPPNTGLFVRLTDLLAPVQQWFRQVAAALRVWGWLGHLSADRYSGLQIRWTNDWHDRSVGHEFDPQGVYVPEIGRLVRLM